MKKILLLLTICIIYLSSCSIEKRLYRPGWNIEKSHSKIKITKSSEIFDNSSSSILNSEVDNNDLSSSNETFFKEKINSQFEDVLLLESNDKINPEIELNYNVKENKQNNSKINVDEPLECDLIVCKNGDEIEAKVLEIGIKEIKYKRCDNEEGPTISILNSNVVMIKYPNGTKDVIKTNIEKEEEPKMNVMALLSLISGILTFTIFASILFGILAIVFSEQAFKEMMKEEGRYSENSSKMAKAGKILGIIGLSLSALILIFVLF